MNNRPREVRQGWIGEEDKLSLSRLLALCRSFSVLSGLAASCRPSMQEVQKALDGLQDLFSFHHIKTLGHVGDIVSFDPEIHYCNKRVEKIVRIVTPAFFLDTPQRKTLLRRAFVQPAVETGLACLYFDVLCEGCFKASYQYTGSHRQILDSVVAMQAHMRIQCPRCSKPAGCQLPYSPGPNYDLQDHALSLVEPEEIEPGATVILKRKDGRIMSLAS
jgi:hypothetical protein